MMSLTDVFAYYNRDVALELGAPLLEGIQLEETQLESMDETGHIGAGWRRDVQRFSQDEDHLSGVQDLWQELNGPST